MKRLDLQSGKQRSAITAAFRAADALGHADHLDIPRSEHAGYRLVESKVLHGILDLAVLDKPDAVARESRDARGASIRSVDVPKSTDDEPSRRRLDHVLDRRRRPRGFHDRIDRTRRRVLSFLLRPESVVDEILENAVPD